MSTELRNLFPILEDAGNSNAGAGLSLKAEGDASGSGGTNYAGIMVAKDPSNDLQFLRMTTGNALIVSTDGDDNDFACVSDEGTIDDGSATLAEAATFALVTTLVYSNLEWVVSCFRDTKFIVEGVEDVGVTDVITILAQGRVGPGQFTSYGRLECREYTAGATGVLALRIRALNNNALSDIDAALAAREIQ